MQSAQTTSGEQFKQSFREEARDILTDLEAALLELNHAQDDMELIGRVFRGMHTIKGSGSMFGFEKLALFTHNLETAFDAVRSGQLPMNSELVDLTLSALDTMRAMVEEDDSSSDSGADLIERLKKLTGTKDHAKSNASPVPAENPKTEEGAQEWKILFAPGPSFLCNGSNPFLLLVELSELGALHVDAFLDALPPLREIDPERCYVRWEMTLKTTAGENSIRDVFIFVEDSCELSIERVESHSVEKEPRERSQVSTPGGGKRAIDKHDKASSLRVPAEKLDQFVDLVGELVTVQARLSELAVRRDDPEISAVSEEVERLTSALRDNSMNIRMTPIRGTFEKFRRLVHDLARDLEKKVELTIDGADTELDKTVIDQLSDPLLHLIRNSMDHGLETEETREARGKATTGTVHLSARYSGASVLVSVSDDGNGIDVDAVRSKAIERGLIAPEAELSDAEVYSLLFEPGFSTAEEVTDISGRGVGMDVVRQHVEGLRGTIEVTSERGKGTCFTLRLPLTLAIIDGLLVSVDDALFVLPLASTLECIELTDADIDSANDKHLVNVRDEIVPYIRLREYFHKSNERPKIEQIMIVETGDGHYGLVVDQVLGDCQTVIKNLGRFYRHVQFVSGATILGNGNVALILDPQRLMQEALRTTQRGRRDALGSGRKMLFA
jgi:two-component system, chemotaxis family, sensor kinase CheA